MSECKTYADQSSSEWDCLTCDCEGEHFRWDCPICDVERPDYNYNLIGGANEWALWNNVKGHIKLHFDSVEELEDILECWEDVGHHLDETKWDIRYMIKENFVEDGYGGWMQK